MSASSASPARTARVVPRRTALRSVSQNFTSPILQLPSRLPSTPLYTTATARPIDTSRICSLPPRPLRNPMRCAQAVVRPEINDSPIRHDGTGSRPPHPSLDSVLAGTQQCRVLILHWRGRRNEFPIDPKENAVGPLSRARNLTRQETAVCNRTTGQRCEDYMSVCMRHEVMGNDGRGA